MPLWLALTACSPTPDPAPPGPSSSPNVLMVSIDTLRRDHLVHMPFLSGWLDGSWHTLDHQQCSNWTFASVACTLTGKLPVEAGWVGSLRREEQVVLPAALETLAERLSGHGYETGLISDNLWLSTQWDTAQGYGFWERGAETALPSARMGLQALSGAAPWFLHVHLITPHAPYDPPEEYLGGLEGLPEISYDLTGAGQYDVLEIFDDIPPEEQEAVEAHLRVRYAADVAWLDDQLAEMFGALEADGTLDDTLVVVWTDHGEQFWEHGHATHAWDLGPEENSAVLGFAGPGVAPAAHAGPTHAIDLVPTVLSLLDLPVPPDLPGSVVGTAPDDRMRFASTTGRGGTLQAVTRGDDKLVFDWKGTLSLWDRAADPEELVDVYDPADPAVPELWDALRVRAEALDPLIPLESPVWPE